jgi:hypothetical protein
MKKILIYSLLIGAMFSSNGVFAEKNNFKERTEQWLQHSEGNLRDDSGSSGDGWIPGGTEPENPIIVQNEPIGDFLPLLVGFSIIYGIYISGKKKEEV